MPGHSPMEKAPAMPTSKHASHGENSIIEAKINRSLRIFVTAALLIALVIPLIESSFSLSAKGQLIARAIDLIAVLTMLFSFIRGFLLNRKLDRQVFHKDKP